MPLTEHGFRKYTYAEILEQQNIRAKDLFGDDIDTSEKSVLGKYIRLNTSDFAQLEDSLEQVYLSRYIDTASGISLDRLTPFAGITRNGAKRALILVVMVNNGTDAVAIPMNTKLVSGTGVLYHTVAPYTIPPKPENGDDYSNQVAVCAECDTAGIVGNIGDYIYYGMQFYQTQIPDISIFSATLKVPGVEAETDAELRVRWKNALSGSGSGTTESIAGNVLRLDGVSDCVVFENNTDSILQNGIPPHSFEVCVNGGNGMESEIAAAIFEKKPLGIGTYGKENAQVTDVAGIQHTIFFSYAEPVSVGVTVTISKEDEPNFIQEQGTKLIREAVAAYFQNYTMGQNVSASSLYAPVIGSGAVKTVESIMLNVGNLPTSTKVKVDMDEVIVLGDVTIIYGDEVIGSA